MPYVIALAGACALAFVLQRQRVLRRRVNRLRVELLRERRARRALVTGRWGASLGPAMTLPPRQRQRARG